VVFAVGARHAIIGEERREELQRYMTDHHKQEQKLLAIYCMPDRASPVDRIKTVHGSFRL
jgi:hypothetical protein